MIIECIFQVIHKSIFSFVYNYLTFYSVLRNKFCNPLINIIIESATLINGIAIFFSFYVNLHPLLLVQFQIYCCIEKIKATNK